MSHNQLVNREIPLRYQFLFACLFILQSAFPKAKIIEKSRKKLLKNLIIVLKKKLDLKGFSSAPSVQIDRVTDLSEDEFVRKYLNHSIPVVFEGKAKDWPCCKKWSLDYFASFFKDEKLQLIESSGLMERHLDPNNGNGGPFVLEELTGPEMINAIKSGDKKYLRFSDFMNGRSELISDLDHKWLDTMKKCFLGVGYKSFVGAAGRKTPIHAGTTAFFYIMAEGEKKWFLYSANSSAVINPRPTSQNYNFTDVDIHTPDLQKYPGFNLITRFETHLKKGDILFVPTWMWHEVENLTDSWGLRYGFTSLRGFLRNPSYAFVRVFLAKPNFFRTLYIAFFKGESSKSGNDLLINTLSLSKPKKN